MVVDGWRLFAHPLFTRQLERLVSQVEALAAQTPERFKNHPGTKLLATIKRYICADHPRGSKRCGVPSGQHARTRQLCKGLFSPRLFATSPGRSPKRK
jgi:toxin YhaV